MNTKTLTPLPANPMASELVPESLRWKAGDKVFHIHANKVVTVESDKGTNNVHVEYVGGKSQFVPRGVLANIDTPAKPQPKVAGGKPLVKVKAPTTPEREELKTFMREICNVEQVKHMANCIGIDIHFSTIASFGMVKMQLMTKLNSRLKLELMTMNQVWDCLKLYKGEK